MGSLLGGRGRVRSMRSAGSDEAAGLAHRSTCEIRTAAKHGSDQLFAAPQSIHGACLQTTRSRQRATHTMSFGNLPVVVGWERACEEGERPSVGVRAGVQACRRLCMRTRCTGRRCSRVCGAGGAAVLEVQGVR